MLRFPANSEIVIEGEIIPGESMQEGPFGEWPGYYASAPRAEPFVRVKALYHRNDPIITGAAPFKPTIHGMYRSCLRAATVWNGMEQAGVPDIKGVYLPPPAQRFMIVVAIKQRYPGHANRPHWSPANATPVLIWGVTSSWSMTISTSPIPTKCCGRSYT